MICLTHDERVAWVAGILDAEGAFMAPSPSAPTKARVSVEMSDEDVIRYLARVVGLAYHERPARHERAKPTYVLLIRGRRALSLMAEVYPYLSARRRAQIDTLLAGVTPPPFDWRPACVVHLCAEPAHNTYCRYHGRHQRRAA